MTVETAPRPALFSKPVLLGASLCVLFAWMIAARVVVPSVLFLGCVYGAAVVFFILGRLPQAKTIVYALIAWMPFSRQLAQDAGTFPSFPTVAVFALVLGAVSLYLNRKSQSVSLAASALHKPVICFLLWGLVCVVNAAAFADTTLGQSFAAFASAWLFPALVAAFAFCTLRTRDAVREASAIFILGIAFSALLAVFEMRQLADVGSFEQARIRGVANDPNVLAAFLNFGLFLPLAFWLAQPRRWYFLVPFLAGVRALMGTFSRGGYLSFAVGLGLTLFFKKKRLLIPFAIAAAAVVLDPGLLPQSVRDRIGHTFEKPVEDAGLAGLDKSNRDRIEIWKAGLGLAASHPILGVGFDRFPMAVRDRWSGRRPFEAHNTYIRIAAEMGVGGLALYLWILWTLGRTAARLRRSPSGFDQAFSAGFLGGFTSLLVSHCYVIRLDMPEVAGYFWIMAALVMRLDKIAAEEIL